MNERPSDPRIEAPESIDDATIASIVRDVADRWTMPPQRLGAPTWHDRVGGVTTRRRSGRFGVRWTRSLVGAASTAVVATVALALVAVWLNVPRSGPATGAASPNASAGSTTDGRPSASGTATATHSPTAPPPAASPLPTLTVFGDPLPATRLLVTGGATYRTADLVTGTLGDDLVRIDEVGNEVVTLPDGRAVCLCGTAFFGVDGERFSLELRWIGPDGTIERTVPVGQYTAPGGAAGPRVEIGPTLAPDGRRFFVGWTAATGSAWRSGIDLVDVATGRLTGGTILPDLPLLNDGTIPGGPPANASRVYPWAPQVRVSPDGRRLMVAQYLTVDEQLAAGERFAADVTGAGVGAPRRLASGHGTLDGCTLPSDGAFATNDVYAQVCSVAGKTVLRRVAPDGSALGDTDLAALGIGETVLYFGAGLTVGSAPVGFVWDPFSRSLVKIDRATGEVVAKTTLPGPTAATDDPLAGLVRSVGAWLAPTALAKMFLDPALAVSPDGTRLYLIGTNATSFTDVSAGSAGIWVVDTGTLGVLDHWRPTADFVSIAASRDGRFVYAAGLPDVGPDGQTAPFQASITVFDAATGRVRAIAGALGRDWLTIRAVLEP